MSRSPHLRHLATAAVLTSLVATAAVAFPAATHAVDPQVCTTAPAPTPATRPWHDFSRQPNPLPPVLAELDAAHRDATEAVRGLGTASTQEEVESVAEVVQRRLRRVYEALTFTDVYDLRDHYGWLRNDLDLVDPAVGMSEADREIVDVVYDELTDQLEPAILASVADGSAYDAYLDGVLAQLTHPLSGPVALPSPAAAATAIRDLVAPVDAWHALGTPRVVWGPPTTTCATTASLVVPAVSTVVGRSGSVTVRATRDDAATLGTFVVLLDGREIGTTGDASSYTVSLPAAQTSGGQVLTVVFDPVDGSPVSTRSSLVTVAKASTRTTLKVTGKRAKVRVVAPGTGMKPTGTVTVKVDGRKVTGRVRDGRTTLALGRLDAGRHRLRAVYSGSGAFARSVSKPVRLTVR